MSDSSSMNTMFADGEEVPQSSIGTSARKARVMFVLGSSELGGAEQNIITLVKHSDRNRITFACLCLAGYGPFVDECEEHGIRVIHSVNWISRAGLEFLRKLRYEVDVLSLYGLRANALFRLVKIFIKTPRLVCNIVSVSWGKRILPVLMEWMTSFAIDQYVANAELCKTVFSEGVRVDPSKILVIYSGITPRVSAYKFRNHDENFVITTVSNIRPMKGHKNIIDAIETIRESIPNVLFQFIGRDDMGGKIQQYAREKGVDDCIDFLGFQKDIFNHLLEAHVFLLASDWEGLSTAVKEAMATGIPVIASHVGAIEELVTNEHNGLLIRPGQPGDIAESVIRLHSDSDLRSRLAEQGLLTLQSRFSPQDAAKQWEHTYLSLLEKCNQ